MRTPTLLTLLLVSSASAPASAQSLGVPFDVTVAALDPYRGYAWP